MAKKRAKRNYLLIGFSYLLTIVAVVIIMLKVFFPYHRIIAITIYGISWIPFIYALFIHKRSVISSKRKNKIIHFVKAYKSFIIWAVVLLAAAYFIWVLFPVEQTVFLNLQNQN